MGGLPGSSAQFFGSAVLFLALGLNEELLYRGVVQHATNTLGAVRSVAWVGLLFGLQHAGTGIFFGRSLYDAGSMVVSSSASGAAYAAVRLRIGTIWLWRSSRLGELLQHPQSQRRALVVVLIGGCLLRSLCGVAGPPVPSRLTF